MKPAPFEYHSPGSVPEAVDLLAELGDEAKVLAGGQSLVPMLALRLAVFGHLIDLGRLPELRGVHHDDGHLRVGAMTTEAEIERDADVAESVPLLSRATPLIGHFQIRNRGTLGGSLAHADPAAEYPAVALALDADFEVESRRGSRRIAAANFFDGLWSTAMAADELLTGVTFSVWTGRCGFGVEEFARRHGDFALAGAVAAVQIDGNDTVQRCAVALIGLGLTPLRARAVEAAAAGRRLREIDAAEVGHQAVADLDGIPSDLHAPARYRRQIASVMTARAWAAATQEALGE